ncbi:DUF418 domain-containing protein [Aliamphritea hakodatensis]|uniref:DUF418 domain-containing protein n=1 Tax=Aliamphritea hakodatensis TaxID=2895352 RepID=UPI0022FDB032|nr:DUF418 domain-containing protein [Aliamphritea hakodatensis]
MSLSQSHTLHTTRLDGLDIARFLAFVGMVIVNFRIIFSGDSDNDFSTLGQLLSLLEGRAAATFVVLAGIGLGLAGMRAAPEQSTFATAIVTLKRSVFLLVLGLLNMLIFDADILHYYAVYFFFGALLLSLRTGYLITVIVSLNILSVLLILTLDFSTGWNFTDLSYTDFWTPGGFIRNLFFNGWHPVTPWLGYLLFGMVLSRCQLQQPGTRWWLIAAGTVAVAGAELASTLLIPFLSSIDPELADLGTTDAVPPMPLYFLAGCGTAATVTGLSLLLGQQLQNSKLLSYLTPAGRHSLTLYIAHILLGMGPVALLGGTGTFSVFTSLMTAFVFCGLSLLFSYHWSRRFKRGPAESLMRRLAG